MKRKIITFLLFLGSIVSLVGCNSDKEELSIGSYENGDTIKFSQFITEEKPVEQFKTIISNATTPTESMERDPDYVMALNNREKSTMEMFVSVWESDSDEIVIKRGFNSEDYFRIEDRNDIQKIKKLIQDE